MERQEWHEGGLPGVCSAASLPRLSEPFINCGTAYVPAAESDLRHRSAPAPPRRKAIHFWEGLIVGIVLGLFLAHWLCWIGFLFILFCLFFFRDPERVPPDRPGAIVAPADGRVTALSRLGTLPAELGLGVVPRWRVSIFLSVLNVHVNRIPANGTVTRIAYQRHGAFLNASL